uniref:Ig-like domain-containing protein n=1 Tax=Callorhinchus milii TaxID=7868 RepID=A0A4W3J2S4_CALMI
MTFSAPQKNTEHRLLILWLLLFMCSFVEPPSFSKEFEQAEVSVAVFQCTVKGSAPITLTWVKDKNIITQSDNIKMTFENNIGTLQIAAVEMNNGGKYSCEIENEAGSQKFAKHLSLCWVSTT